MQVGTSGWSYPTWRPGFYPASLRPEEFLAYYASRLSAVELNATSYRLPAAEQFRRWAAQVPETFRFAVKAPPGIERRLPAVEERIRELGERLGCVRIVVTRQRDEDWLETLARSAHPAVRYALDLRHPSWDGIEPRLAELGWARVDRPCGRWCYVRFRGPPWSEQELREIAARVRALVSAGSEVFAFFRHEDEPRAPLAALRLRRLLA